jgi:hypothetical protein
MKKKVSSKVTYLPTELFYDGIKDYSDGTAVSFSCQNHRAITMEHAHRDTDLTLQQKGITRFPYKILFGPHFNHSIFLPSADVKPVSNDQMHAVSWQACLHSLCVIEIGLEQAPFVLFYLIFSSFEHVKSLLIIGPNNTKNSSLK